MSILISSNIHDRVYAHITTSINISQDFKYIKFIKHGEIYIIVMNHSKSIKNIISNLAHINQALKIKGNSIFNISSYFLQDYAIYNMYHIQPILHN